VRHEAVLLARGNDLNQEDLLSMSQLFGRRRVAASLLAFGLGALVVAGARSPGAHAQSRSASTLFLNGAGSTFVYPLMNKWAFTYGTKVDKRVRINYQSIGSGAGIQQFTAGTVDFGASDGFMSDAQIKAAGGDVLHIPLTIGPEAVTYNLSSLKSPLRLDGPTLALIYQGKITNWNDKAIAALNPGVTLPSEPIVVAHRSDGSGTTFIFTDYLSNVSKDWAANVGHGTAVNWPTGQGGRGNAGVAAIVTQTPGAIGYVELSYLVSSHLVAAELKNKDGKFVAPSIAGAAADVANAGTLPADLRASVVNEPGAASYPITGFSWALIHQKAPNNTRYPTLLRFLWWCTHQGQAYSSAGLLRYAPLPANIVKADEAKIKSVTYNGKPVYTG
jgi:phosphate transport system substrate-binding protein